jgi:large conductance mechanosensitive channel
MAEALAEVSPMDLKSFDPTKTAWSLWDEFRAFAFKGNVIDLAVGVIIGAAFSSIVKSLVDHIFMPLISVVMPGNQGYKDWALTVRGKTIQYGLFLADVVNFLIVALALYLFIAKFLGWIMAFKKQEAPALTKDQKLLTEIRDLLKRPAADGPEGPRPD